MRPPSEQRRASRLPVPLEHEEAELRYGGESYPARLVDQSAGGFGLQLECDIDLDRDQTAALAWAGGCCRVRVISRINEPNYIRLGVKRLNELDSIQDLDEQSSLWSLWDPGRPRPETNYSYSIIGCLLVGGVAISALMWQFMPHRADITLQAPSVAAGEKSEAAAAARARRRAAKTIEDASHWIENGSWRTALAKSPMPQAAREWSAASTKTLSFFVRSIVRQLAGMPTGARRATAVVEHTAAQAIDQVREVAESGNDMLMVSLPQFMNLLDLSFAQRRKLDALLQATHTATQEIQRRSRELGTQQVMQEIADVRARASEQAMAILSAPQLERLRSLASTAPQHSSARPVEATPQ